MKQEEAANFLDITTRHYRQLESGGSDGSVKIWERLSQRFNVSINDLLAQDVDITQPDYSNSILGGVGQAKELESAIKSFGLDVDAIIDIAQDGRLDEPARRETAERLAKVLVAVLSGKNAA
jgi:transcriptional regulator with XRE-family HTH domain